MWAPDFARDIWLQGLSDGAKNAEAMVWLAKVVSQLVIAMFLLMGAVAALTILELIQLADGCRPQIDDLKRILPELADERGEFKQRFPTLYDKFFWFCPFARSQSISRKVSVPKTLSIGLDASPGSKVSWARWRPG
jgi:hypothetical protein